jgi:hypothetical protein
MVDLTAIGVVSSSLNTAISITKALMDVRDATAVQGKVLELQRAIIEAQDSVFVANAERSALIEEIGEAKEKIARLEAWETEKKRYDLQDVGAGSFAYVLKETMRGTEPPHKICANCYEHAQKSILQPLYRNQQNFLLCPKCRTEIYVGFQPWSVG